MALTFSTPWLLLLALPVVALAVATVLRSRTRLLPSFTLATLRTFTALCVIAALCGPHTTTQKPADDVAVLVDISSSITPTQGEALLARAQTLGRELGVPLRLVPFGASASTASSTSALATLSSFGELRRQWQKLDVGTTNIASAISLEAARGSAAALVLSDGYETAGSALQTSSASPGLALFPLTERGNAEVSDVSISQLYAPLTVKAQSSVDIKVTLSNSASKARKGTLTITHGEREVFKQAVTLQTEGDSLFSAESDPAAEGISPVVATFSWSDETGSHHITRSTWLAGETRDKVLLLSGTSDDARILPQLLQNQRYQLASFVAPFAQDQLRPLSDYRTVILNNVALTSLPSSLAQTLPDFVRGGGGLIMIGGNKSFGLGGYIGSTIEPLLPVRLVPPYKEKKRLNVAVQLVIDKSRSMAADDRLEFAKAAAAEVIQSLQDDDYIGVVGFDETPFIALPLTQVSLARATARDKVNRLYPFNKTNLFPALDEARRGLQRVNAGRKHTIVLTDGKIPDASSEYLSLVRQMRVLGVTVSTVLLGSDADDGFLANIAEQGGGSFYQTSDPRNLPRIFISDVKVASGEQTLRESPELPVQRGPSGIRSTSLDSFPSLRGFVETLSRDGAYTELTVSQEDKTFPLLASTSIGKGRSIAFTSDVNGRWSAKWLQWSSLQAFWSDLVESLHPQITKTDSSTSFDVRSWIDGGEAVVELTIYGTSGLSGVSGEISTPRGDTRSLDLKSLAPGRHQARVSQPTAGKYEALFSVGGTPLPRVAWELSGELFGETPHEKPNLTLLEQLASKTQGKVNPKAADLKGRLKTAADTHPYAPHALIVALLLLFLEVLLREFAFKSKR